MKKPSLLLPVIFLLCICSCSKDNPNGGSAPNCNTTPKSFSTDVDPIIQGRCNLAGCHAAGSTNGPGPLTTYTEVFNAKSQIRPAITSGTMPQGTTLSSSQKNSIICWIDSGAPNN